MRRRPTLAEQIDAAHAHGQEEGIHLRAFQVFIAGPRNRAVTLGETEAKELKTYIAEAGNLWVVAHGTFLDAPWSGQTHAAKFIRKEIAICHEAGIRGLVIHLGIPGPDQVLTYLPRLMTGVRGVRVYLEVPHVLPDNSSYETPEKLAMFFRAIRLRLDTDLEYFGLCIDAAHLWSCGVNLSSYEDAANWLESLEAAHDVIPPSKIMFHLNDSFDELGAGTDRHAPLFRGNIWGAYAEEPQKSGLAAFVHYAVRHGVPVILERKDPDPTVKDPRAVLRDDYGALLELAPSLGLD